MKRYLSDYRFWIIVVGFLGLGLVHNSRLFSLNISPFVAAGLARYAFERVLFLAIIIFTSYIYGKKAGIASTVIAVGIMLPNSLLLATSRVDAIFETLGVVAVGILVTVMLDMRNCNIAQLRSHQAHIIELSRQLVSASEIEREKIGQELHDSVGQSLTVVSLAVHNLRNSLPDEIRPALNEVESLIGDAVRDVRDVSHLLKPPLLEDAGLVMALESYFELLSSRGGLKVEFLHEGLVRRLPGVLEAVVFRIIQEALTNVSRHAGVKEVKVSILDSGDRLVLEITDKGIGFDIDTLGGGSLGISGMQERAELLGGMLSVDSIPGKGTVVKGEFPIWLKVG
jgi:two-component system sensor histidine kinase DegS